MKKTQVRLFVLCSLLLVLSKSTTAQELDTASVDLIAYWSKGDIFRYQVTKGRIDIENDKQTRKSEASYLLTLQVLDSTENDYTVHAKYDYDDMGDMMGELPSVLRDALDLVPFSAIAVRYRTDELGSVEEVLNYDEVHDSIKLYTDRLIDALEQEQSLPDEVATAVRRLISENSDTMVESFMTDIRLLHRLLGIRYNLSDTLNYEESLTIPVYNMPVETAVNIHVEEYDDEEDYLEVHEHRSYPDMNSTTLMKMMEKFDFMTDKVRLEEMRKAFENMTLAIAANTVYTFDSYWGIPLYVEAIQEIDVSDRDKTLKRKQLHRIELLGVD